MATEGAEMEPQGQEPETEEIETLELTKEEYESALQKESDKRVTQALKKREAEFKKQLEEKTEEARKEAEELAKLSESERRKVEKEKEELKMEKERESLQSERAEFEREKLQLQAEKELAIRSLPEQFAKYILGEDAEGTMERITVFEEQWQEALEEAIQEKLKAKTPKLGGGKKGFFTREQVATMSQEEVNANLSEIEESMTKWK